MRPVIRRRRGIWCCCRIDPVTRMPLWPLGHGYTPGDALRDWQEAAN
jgi:hypothetical protein